MSATPYLETPADAGRNITPARSRATVCRWLQKHPGLGLTIGGRHFMFGEAREAIARGVPLAEAARIGAECAERARNGRREAA